MKNQVKYFIFSFLLASTFTSCLNYKRLINDEVVLKDGNSQTGTIVQSDSANLKIKKIDESINIIPWSNVDTVLGKKFKTIWFGANLGFYNTPYFSVFRNEKFDAHQFGMQGKVGIALRGSKLYYFDLSFSPARPYSIKKFGVGYQRYLGKSSYLKNNCYFIGSEFNFMAIKYNNGLQTVFEPYTGFEKKLNENLRVHFKFALQINIANKNSNAGFNATVGIHFMKKNFKKHYDFLNKEHWLNNH
jgi:hypothetical protein